MLSKKSNTKEYLNNKVSQTRAVLGFAREGQYCYKLKFSPLHWERRGKWYMELSRLSTPPVEKRGKRGLEILRPITPPVEKRGKGVKVFSWFLFLLVWCDWGVEVLRPTPLHIVKMGIPLSKGEGRVRVQHGGCKNISRQTSSCNTILESPFRGVLIVTKSTCSYDQCTPTKGLKKVRYKNLSRKASSINAGMEVRYKKW